MGNPNQHESSIENKPEKSGGTIPPHQVLAQIAPERGEQLRQITQLSATASLTGLPRLAVEDRSNPFATQIGSKPGSSQDGFERFLASLTPNKAALDATANGAGHKTNVEIDGGAAAATPFTNAAKVDVTPGIRIDVVNQSASRSRISLDDVLSQAPIKTAGTELPQGVVRIPGRTDMESALNGLMLAGQIRAGSPQPDAERAEGQKPAGAKAEPMVTQIGEADAIAQIGEAHAVITATEQAAAVHVEAERTVGKVAEEPIVIRASEESGVTAVASLPAPIASEQVGSVRAESLSVEGNELPLFTAPMDEPVVASATEVPVPKAAAEPIVALATEEPIVARATEATPTAKAVEETLSRMLEGAGLRTPEESVAAKGIEALARSGNELPASEARLEREPSATGVSPDAPYIVPTTATNVVIPDSFESSELHPHGHHHQSTNIFGASLTVGFDSGFENGNESHNSASHYHWHGTFHGHGYHRPLHGNGIDGRPEYAAFAPKGDTLVVTARSMVFTPDSNKRFMTGAEIALGVVLVAGAIAKAKEHAAEDREKQEEAAAEATDAVSRRRKDPDSINYFQKLTANNSTRASWIVGTGDTLTSLGDRFYEDARVGYLIAQINRELSQQHRIDGKLVVQLFTRQTIYLPNKEDLQQFYGRDLSELKAENLVTIVSEREFDRQLVNMIMNRAMGITTEPATTAAQRPAFALASATERTVAAGGSPLNERAREQHLSAQDRQAEASDNDRQPPLPPQGTGALSLAGFLSYLRSKYKSEPDVASIARARLSLRCKF